MALVFGGLSALGLAMVANFQVTIKNIFLFYLKYSYSANRMLIRTVKTNIIKKIKLW